MFSATGFLSALFLFCIITTWSLLRLSLGDLVSSELFPISKTFTSYTLPQISSNHSRPEQSIM